MTVTETAVRMAVAEAARPTRGPLISTSPTVTSGLFGAGQAANLRCRCVFTTVCRTHAYAGALGS
jgi:hypothetical protein